MKCKVCGSEIGPNDTVCKGCGIPVEKLKADGNIENVGGTEVPAAQPEVKAEVKPEEKVAAPVTSEAAPKPVTPPVQPQPKPVTPPPAQPAAPTPPPTPVQPAPMPTPAPMDNSFVDEKPKKKGPNTLLVILATLVVAGLGVYLAYMFLPSDFFCKEKCKECEVCEVCEPCENETPTEDELSCTVDTNQNNVRTTGNTKAEFKDDKLVSFTMTKNATYLSTEDLETDYQEAQTKYAAYENVEGVNATVNRAGTSLTINLTVIVADMTEDDFKAFFNTANTSLSEAEFKTYSETDGFTCPTN